MTVKVFAPAKVNLTLHVTGQRDDGFHLIDSLVAFGPARDRLTIRSANALSLTVKGPEAAGVPTDASNLVMRAAAIFAQGRGAEMKLEKDLPAASGIGGGSADAAAALRGLLAHWDTGELVDAPDQSLRPFAKEILALGADVPMCFLPSPLRATGIGEKIEFVQQVPPLPMLLVNPRVSVATADIFAALKSKNNAAMTKKLPGWNGLTEFCSWLALQRNDLEAPALALHPEIGRVLEILNATESVLISRMSGSGATCFAIHADKEHSLQAAARIHADHPDWWVRAGWAGSKFKSAVPVLS